MPTTNEQKASLVIEVQTAIRLIEAGLREVQRIDGAYDFYHLLMLSLGGGFERLMKSIICLQVLGQTGSFPEKCTAWSGKKGHNLENLLHEITEDCFNESYLQKVPAARQDIDFLRGDARLKKIVRILSRFGQAARYHELDVILGKAPPTDSPEQEWCKLELGLLQEYSDWAKMLQGGKIDEAYKLITSEIVRRIELFARALCRLFTIRELGDLAKQQTGTITTFLFLNDDHLGNRRY